MGQRSQVGFLTCTAALLLPSQDGRRTAHCITAMPHVLATFPQSAGCIVLDHAAIICGWEPAPCSCSEVPWCTCRSYDRADEVILLGLQWLRSLPHGICAEAGVRIETLSREGGGAQHPLLHKLLALALGASFLVIRMLLCPGAARSACV